MDLQLIFVVEANKKSKSDWIYIKTTIDHFFTYDTEHIKLTPVYMGGKGKYKDREKEINKLISQYAAQSPERNSRVIYCFDCDEYDRKPDDKKFLDDAKDYCCQKNYEFAWFCKDIERVYLSKKNR